MNDIRKTCNLGYFHYAHAQVVMLVREDGTMDKMVNVFCGGSHPKEKQ